VAIDLYKELHKTEADLDNTPLTFGKYAGWTPDEVADEDPSYIVWLWENTDIRRCSKAMYVFCKKSIVEDDGD
jgi:hypothetical protein